jgi:hypothetical protein
VVLEAPAPVGGLPDIPLGQDLVEVLDVLPGDRPAHADGLGVVRRDGERELAVGHAQDEVLLLLALDARRLALFLLLDHRRPVMGVDDAITDFERHERRGSLLRCARACGGGPPRMPGFGPESSRTAAARDP